jgi:LPXTG-site transpeptidase (sortase) family protein
MQLKILPKRTLLVLAGLALSPALFFCFFAQSSAQGDSALMNSIVSEAFSDVPSTHLNYEAINYIQAQNIVDGYPDGTFRPDNLINRAESTKIITEAYYRGQANGSNCFPDVGTEWFAKYVCFYKVRNFIVGYPDGTFKPAIDINFVEIAKILVNIKGFSVTPDSNTWYKPYVEKLAEVHAIPTSIKSFNQKVTRGEMAEMIYRLRANITNEPSKTYEEMIQERVNAELPVRLKIPGINVDAAIEYVGVTPEGAVGIPKDPANVAWFDLGPRPGDSGSAVITGHINWYYGATGVFADLHKVKPGDKIIVQDNKGAATSFVVREIRSYDAAADAIEVFSSRDGKAHLNLITCAGEWDSRTQQYPKRLVIFTDKEME